MFDVRRNSVVPIPLEPSAGEALGALALSPTEGLSAQASAAPTDIDGLGQASRACLHKASEARFTAAAPAFGTLAGANCMHSARTMHLCTQAQRTRALSQAVEAC